MRSNKKRRRKTLLRNKREMEKNYMGRRKNKGDELTEKVQAERKGQAGEKAQVKPTRRWMCCWLRPANSNYWLFLAECGQSDRRCLRESLLTIQLHCACHIFHLRL
jgi:hypothetical protein